MKRRAFFFRIGAFSLINDAVEAGLRAEFPDLAWTSVDVERDIVGANRPLRLHATLEALARYGRRIAAHRQPLRDFFPRLPVVIEAVRAWVRRNVDPATTAFTFQTQSLFDAAHPGLPHFLYTDHTYLANLRYPEPRPLLSVPAAWRDMERSLYATTRVNFASSAFAAESLVADYGVPADRVANVFSGQNVPPSPPVARSGRVILFVGVDWERKGGPELVSAFRAVRATRPTAELWIVGCSPAIEEPGVRVFGRLAPAEVAARYEAADVFCLPSRMDPSASVLGEAALRGLPVVATNVGGNGERVLDGATGFLCPPVELADRLGRLLDDATLRLRLGEAGRAWAQERFTWEAVCRKMAARMRPEIVS